MTKDPTDLKWLPKYLVFGCGFFPRDLIRTDGQVRCKKWPLLVRSAPSNNYFRCNERWIASERTSERANADLASPFDNAMKAPAETQHRREIVTIRSTSARENIVLTSQGMLSGPVFEPQVGWTYLSCRSVLIGT